MYTRIFRFASRTPQKNGYNSHFTDTNIADPYWFGSVNRRDSPCLGTDSIEGWTRLTSRIQHRAGDLRSNALSLHNVVTNYNELRMPYISSISKFRMTSISLVASWVLQQCHYLLSAIPSRDNVLGTSQTYDDFVFVTCEFPTYWRRSYVLDTSTVCPTILAASRQLWEMLHVCFFRHVLKW